jgi:hypothetical protein
MGQTGAGRLADKVNPRAVILRSADRTFHLA